MKSFEPFSKKCDISMSEMEKKSSDFLQDVEVAEHMNVW